MPRLLCLLLSLLHTSDKDDWRRRRRVVTEHFGRLFPTESDTIGRSAYQRVTLCSANVRYLFRRYKSNLRVAPTDGDGEIVVHICRIGSSLSCRSYFFWGTLPNFLQGVAKVFLWQIGSIFSQAGLTALRILIVFASWRQPHCRTGDCRVGARPNSSIVTSDFARLTNTCKTA